MLEPQKNTVLSALRSCVEELDRLRKAGADVSTDVLYLGREAIADRRRKASKAGCFSAAMRLKRNVKLRLPWDDIDAERERGTTWTEIRDRLELLGIRIHATHIARLWKQRKAAGK